MLRYDAIGQDGKGVRGRIRAVSVEDAAVQLRARGLVPVRIVADDGRAAAERHRPAVAASKATLLILRELAVLLRAGLTVPRALAVIARLLPAASRRRVEAVMAGVRGGAPLAEAMAVSAPGLFPAPVRGAIAAGAASGHLVDVLDQLVAGIARDLSLRQRILSILAYPLILLLVMAAALAVILGVVVPRMEPLLTSAGVDLPWLTHLVIGLAHLMRDWGEALAGLAIVALGLTLLALRAPGPRRRLERWLLETRLLLGLPRRMAAARFCHVAGTLLKGGVTLDRALEGAAAAVGNHGFQDRIRRAVPRVRRGERLAAVLGEAGVLPPVVIELAAVGDETASLGPMLHEAATALDAEIGVALDRLATLLPPVLTLLMGMLVAGLMAGVVSGLLAANSVAF